MCIVVFWRRNVKRKISGVDKIEKSMIEKEAEKINSAVLKYIIMFVVIISLAKSSTLFVRGGVMFKFVFLNIILGMGKSPTQDPQQEIVKSIVEDPIRTSEDLNNDGMYDIVSLIGNEYVVKTHKGLKRVKIKTSDNKRIGDQIKIERL